jgi:hypothetical protein
VLPLTTGPPDEALVFLFALTKFVPLGLPVTVSGTPPPLQTLAGIHCAEAISAHRGWN